MMPRDSWHSGMTTVYGFQSRREAPEPLSAIDQLTVDLASIFDDVAAIVRNVWRGIP